MQSSPARCVSPIATIKLTADLRQSLAHGFYDGVGGFFYKPYKGARDEGVLGFAKGCGKGLSGIVLEPVSGKCSHLQPALWYSCSLASRSTRGLWLRRRWNRQEPRSCWPSENAEEHLDRQTSGSGISSTDNEDGSVRIGDRRSISRADGMMV